MRTSNKEQAVQDYIGRHEDVLTLAAGELSEDLISYVAGKLDDDMLDGVEIYRDMERRDDLASEPVTIGIAIGLSTAAVVAVGRIIERWIEKRRQRENVELVIEAYKLAPEAGRIIAGLAMKHAEVSVSYSLSSATPSTDPANLEESSQE